MGNESLSAFRMFGLLSIYFYALLYSYHLLGASSSCCFDSFCFILVFSSFFGFRALFSMHFLFFRLHNFII